MTKKMRIAAGLMALAILAGCSKSEPEAQPPETDNVGADAQPEPAAQPTPEPAPIKRPEPAPVANTVVPVAAEPREAPPSPDAQMLDDADATGMTARVSRQEAQGNDTRAQ